MMNHSLQHNGLSENRVPKLFMVWTRWNPLFLLPFWTICQTPPGSKGGFVGVPASLVSCCPDLDHRMMNLGFAVVNLSKTYHLRMIPPMKMVRFGISNGPHLHWSLPPGYSQPQLSRCQKMLDTPETKNTNNHDHLPWKFFSVQVSSSPMLFIKPSAPVWQFWNVSNGIP